MINAPGHTFPDEPLHSGLNDEDDALHNSQGDDHGVDGFADDADVGYQEDYEDHDGAAVMTGSIEDGTSAEAGGRKNVVFTAVCVIVLLAVVYLGYLAFIKKPVPVQVPSPAAVPSVEAQRLAADQNTLLETTSEPPTTPPTTPVAAPPTPAIPVTAPPAPPPPAPPSTPDTLDGPSPTPLMPEPAVPSVPRDPAEAADPLAALATQHTPPTLSARPVHGRSDSTSDASAPADTTDVTTDASAPADTTGVTTDASGDISSVLGALEPSLLPRQRAASSHPPPPSPGALIEVDALATALRGAVRDEITPINARLDNIDGRLTVLENKPAQPAQPAQPARPARPAQPASSRTPARSPARTAAAPGRASTSTAATPPASAQPRPAQRLAPASRPRNTIRLLDEPSEPSLRTAAGTSAARTAGTRCNLKGIVGGRAWLQTDRGIVTLSVGDRWSRQSDIGAISPNEGIISTTGRVLCAGAR